MILQIKRKNIKKNQKEKVLKRKNLQGKKNLKKYHIKQSLKK